MRLKALTLTFAVTLAATGALFTAAAPAGAQEVTAADCGAKTYRWLFFPEGHGALKGVPHAATEIPHVDVYSGKGKKFTEAQNVAYADGTAASTTATCTPAQPAGSGSATVKSTISPAQVVCTSKVNPVFVIVPESTVDLPSITATVDGKFQFHAQMGSSTEVASTLDYDGKSCKLAKLPK